MKADLKQRMCDLVDAVVDEDHERAEGEFEHLFGMAKALFDAKQKMVGTKSQTRDLLGEILFTRMRRSFQVFLGSPEAKDEIRVAEWVLGAVLGGSSLREFASVLDHVILQSSSPTDFSFAGRADFISIEEVMQLLGAGKHTGCLSLETSDNRIDLYVNHGQIAFMDPHHMVRRVIPIPGQMDLREITQEDLMWAYKHAYNLQTCVGKPMFLALDEKGWFAGLDLRQTMRQLGSEVLYEFLREQGQCNFFYRQMDELPEFVIDHDLRIGITPILLEGSKQIDDWSSLYRVFPDRHEPVHPAEDLYAKIGDLSLSVLEIKMLTQLTGDNSPHDLVEIMGIPILEVYQHLVRFARVGAITPTGGEEALQDVTMSVEESMELAFEALDANDDNIAVSAALDKVFAGDLFGEDDEAKKPTHQETGKFSLDLGFLNAAHEDDADKD